MNDNSTRVIHLVFGIDIGPIFSGFEHNKKAKMPKDLIRRFVSTYSRLPAKSYIFPILPGPRSEFNRLVARRSILLAARNLPKWRFYVLKIVFEIVKFMVSSSFQWRHVKKKKKTKNFYETTYFPHLSVYNIERNVQQYNAFYPKTCRICKTQCADVLL